MEAALLNWGLAEVTVEGYAALYAIAVDNLILGRNVVADCVNPVSETRIAWAATAAQAGSCLVNLEIVCSDPAEHERRVTQRYEEESGRSEHWSPPTWAQVEARRAFFIPWTEPRLVWDTAAQTPEQSEDALWAMLANEHLVI